MRDTSAAVIYGPGDRAQRPGLTSCSTQRCCVLQGLQIRHLLTSWSDCRFCTTRYTLALAAEGQPTLIVRQSLRCITHSTAGTVLWDMGWSSRCVVSRFTYYCSGA
jgi:hypothetical protein